MRDPPMPSVEVDNTGKVYVVWADCRFRAGCPSNDIVMSTSTDGQTWTSPVRIPIEPIANGYEHFHAGLAVDRGTGGATAHLGLGYYYYPQASCSPSTCELTFGFVSSLDSGTTWSAPKQVSGPMKPIWIAYTNQGYMVGDYTSSSFTGDGKRTRSSRSRSPRRAAPTRPATRTTAAARSAWRRRPSTSPLLRPGRRRASAGTRFGTGLLGVPRTSRTTRPRTSSRDASARRPRSGARA